MPDPVAWVLIEPGWKVVSSDGEDVGRVDERVGDENVDIFDGLAIATPALGFERRYVPSEQVGDIYEGEVHLKLTRAEVERLDEYDEPPASEEIEPVDAPSRVVQALKRAFFLDRGE
jgi:hypothetical protein